MLGGLGVQEVLVLVLLLLAFAGGIALLWTLFKAVVRRQVRKELARQEKARPGQQSSG